jgi:hypothetical protein
MADSDTTPRCEACGEPATRTDAEGVLLCEGDYQHLVEHWVTEGFGGSEVRRISRCLMKRPNR